MAWDSDLVRTKDWGTEILTDADLEGQYDVIITWIMAAFNASTGHNHTGASNRGPRLASTGVTTTFGNGFTTVTGVSTDYLLIAADASDSNTTKKALASDFIYVPTAANALAGSVIQVVEAETASVIGSNASIPRDDSVPQSSEGFEVITAAITPNATTNKLVILFEAGYGVDISIVGAALFQDATASAISATTSGYTTANNGSGQIVLRHYMSAGTTSATTFKVRVGNSASGDYPVINGISTALGGTRCYGGVSKARLTILEVKV